MSDPTRPLEELVIWVFDDPEDSPEQVRQDLASMGVDIDASKARFKAFLAQQEQARRRRSLDRFRAPPLHPPRDRVTRRGPPRPRAQILAEIRAVGGTTAYREYTSLPDEDLETVLEDLRELQRRHEDRDRER